MERFQALKYSYLSLKMYERSHNIKMIGYVWMRIGIVQYYLKSYKESLAAFEEALQFAKQGRDNNSEAVAIQNIGVIYFIQAENTYALRDIMITLKKCEALKQVLVQLKTGAMPISKEWMNRMNMVRTATTHTKAVQAPALPKCRSDPALELLLSAKHPQKI